jgi:phosphoribosylaminoimidazole-succinocarboxamide synthase
LALFETPLPNLLYRGKVRDTFDLGEDLLLMVATDRISAFDVVLPTGIPDKGYVLSRLSEFWFARTRNIVPNHLVGMAGDVASLGAVAQHPLLKTLPPQIARQAMVVHKAERIDVECVVRAYLAGSAWAEYRKLGTIAGEPAPEGLQEGGRLPQLLFTPTTKAETGHDMPMTKQEVSDLVGADTAQLMQETSFAVFRFAHDFARRQGIIIADTKMEFGFVGGQFTLIDELLTPDSSRFWDADGYDPGRPQPNYDKQFVRDWLLNSGWNQEPPAPELPENIVLRTKDRYLGALQRLTGQTLP